MHTCLSLSNVDCHSQVEDEVADLADRLNAFCDSIDSCHISVEQTSGESAERYWRIAVSLRILDENVRATIRQPAGPDPMRLLANLLEQIYARAIEQMTQIAKRHHCSCAGPERLAASHCKECA